MTGELRFAAEGDVARAIIVHETPTGFLIQRKWGKLKGGAATFVRQFGAREATLLLSNGGFGKRELDVELTFEAMEDWRAKCLKAGLKEYREFSI